MSNIIELKKEYEKILADFIAGNRQEALALATGLVSTLIQEQRDHAALVASLHSECVKAVLKDLGPTEEAMDIALEANLLLVHIFTTYAGNFCRQVEEKSRNLDDLAKNLKQQVANEVDLRIQKDEALMRQSRQSAMGQSVNSIAHQWRRPLNIIGLTIQDMQDAFAFGELDAQYVEQSVEQIMKQVHLMSKTIDDFKAFFAPSTEKSFFDIKTATADALSLIEAQLHDNDITYRFVCHVHHDVFEKAEEVLPCSAMTVEGYLSDFKQAVLQILNNAADAIKEKKHQGLMDKDEKGHILIDFHRLDNQVIVKIENNGSAIPDEIADRIYDPYFTTKSEGKAMGMGLYTAKTLIEKHLGGSIELEKITIGTLFTIRLFSAHPHDSHP